MQLGKACGLCSRSRHGGLVSKMGRKSESPSIVCIITARGGSKSLCRKNLLPLVGKAVIAWFIEAASFRLPVFNVGNRQGGRIRAKNVIDVECETDTILKGIQLATSAKFRHGLKPVHNTPEEIQSLAIEMDERLNGTWITSEEDEMLQKRFWSLFQTSELNGVFISRIGTGFLKQNQDLLA